MIDIETEGRSFQLDLDTDMALSDEGLHDAMCRLPRTIARYAQIMGECKMYAANMKRRMEMVEAKVDMDIRKEAKNTGDKVTEPGIAKQVTLNQEVSSARSAYYKAEAQFSMVEGFYRALRDKSQIAIAMCYFQKEEVKFMGVG